MPMSKTEEAPMTKAEGRLFRKLWAEIVEAKGRRTRGMDKAADRCLAADAWARRDDAAGG
jgi:hypothetical protein